MIRAKTDGKGKTSIEVDGTNVELLAECVAIVESISKTVFADSEKAQLSFVLDIPKLVLNMDSRITTTRMDFSPEQLKKMLEEGQND